MRKQQYKSCFTNNKKFIPIHDLSDELLNKIYEKYNIEIPNVYESISRTGCFTPDVEICTNTGFKRLDCLKGDEHILTISDDGNKEFRKYKKVEYDFNGNLIRVKLQNKYVYTTPDHKFIGYHRNKKDWIVCDADDMSMLSIPSNMRFIDDNTHLTDIERIYIAVQADGSLQRKYCNYTFRFNLKKKRKIERLKSLLVSANVKWYENKRSDGTSNINIVIDKDAKNLLKCFDYINIGVTKAREIIEEMILWDGYKDKNGRMHFSSINQSQVDFYACVSAIAGYSHYKGQMVSNKKNRNDLHYLIIYTKFNRNYRQTSKFLKYYSGKVHCVDIGGRLCLFRSDGKTFVAYNCVGCPYGSWKHDTEKELALMNPNQKKYVCELFKESYDVLGIDYKGGGAEQ